MTDIEVKQLIERLRQRTDSKYMLMSDPPKPAPDADCHMAADLLQEALAFKQEVSDAVEDYFGPHKIQSAAARNAQIEKLNSFIIPKPDPLVEVMVEATAKSSICENDFAANIRAALEARGLEIRSKNDG